MADSGIESGSITSPQETVSEDSSTELNEPNDYLIQRKIDKTSSVNQKLASSAHCVQENIQNETGKMSEIAKCEQKNHFSVLDDSADNIPPQFEVCATFKLGPSFVSLDSSKNVQKYEDQLSEDTLVQNGRKPHITVEVSFKQQILIK